MANTFLNKDGLSHLVSKLKTYIASQISAHTSNKSNPHGVTKSQVGLGSVANIDQSKAIKSITRSGTTFTATALDGTQTTFDQQDSNTTYGVATESSNGLMSASDKSALDGLKTHSHGLLNQVMGTNNTVETTSGTWNDIIGDGGDKSGPVLKTFRTGAKSPEWALDSVACGIAFGAVDVRAAIMVDYASWKKRIRAVGCHGNNIDWYADILHSLNYKDYVKSTTKSFTLSASGWSSGTYTISDSLITDSSNQEILPATTITSAQYNALSKAQIIDGGQLAGKLTLKALGTVPTIDIPIRVIFRGTI